MKETIIQNKKDLEKVEDNTILIFEKDLQLNYTFKKLNNIKLQGPATISGSLNFIKINDLKLENIRIRNNNSNIETDCIYLKGCKNVLIQNCSFSHGTDEQISIDDSEVLIENTIIGPPLHFPILNGKPVHPDSEPHGYGLRASVSNITISKCLFVDLYKRSPQFNNENIEKNKKYVFDMRDSFIYNYSSGFVFNSKKEYDIPAKIYFNFYNNTFIPGKRTAKNSLKKSLEFDFELSKKTKLKIRGLETNKICHYNEINVNIKKEKQIKTEPANNFDLKNIGTVPLDEIDKKIQNRIFGDILIKPEYDCLDPETVFLRWGESDWLLN